MGFFLSVWVLFILALMWVPLPPGSSNFLGQADLLIHFGLFLVFGGVLLIRLSAGSGDSPAAGLTWWAALVLVLSLVAEAGQMMVPGRTISVMDFSMNLAGSVYGAFVKTQHRTTRAALPVVACSGLIIMAAGGLETLSMGQLLRLVYQTGWEWNGDAGWFASLLGLAFLLRTGSGKQTALAIVVEALFLVYTGVRASPLQTLSGGMLLGTTWVLLGLDVRSSCRSSVFLLFPLIFVWGLQLFLPFSWFVHFFGIWFLSAFTGIPALFCLLFPGLRRDDTAVWT